MKLREKVRKWFRLRSLQVRESSDSNIDNVDAVSAARANAAVGPFGGHGAAPPGYTKSYDEGRPRK